MVETAHAEQAMFTCTEHRCDCSCMQKFMWSLKLCLLLKNEMALIFSSKILHYQSSSKSVLSLSTYVHSYKQATVSLKCFRQGCWKRFCSQLVQQSTKLMQFCEYSMHSLLGTSDKCLRMASPICPQATAQSVC